MEFPQPIKFLSETSLPLMVPYRIEIQKMVCGLLFNTIVRSQLKKKSMDSVSPVFIERFLRLLLRVSTARNSAQTNNAGSKARKQ